MPSALISASTTSNFVSAFGIVKAKSPTCIGKVDIILLPGKNVKKSLKKWKAGNWFIYFGCKNPLKTRLCPTFAHFNAGFRPCDRHAQQGHAILPCDAFTRIVVVDVGHCQFFGLETQTRLLVVAASLNIFPAPEPLEVPACLEPKTTSTRSLKSLIHTAIWGHLLPSLASVQNAMILPCPGLNCLAPKFVDIVSFPLHLQQAVTNI